MADFTLEELEAFEEKIKDLKESFDAEYVEKYSDAIDGLVNLLGDEGLEKASAAFDEIKLSMELGLPSAEKFRRALERSTKTLTGVTDASNTLIGSFANLIKEEGSLGGAFKKTGKILDKTLSTYNIGISLTRKLAEGSWELAKANDRAMASFNRVTGAGGRYNEQILTLEKSNRRFGIGAAEAGASLQSLIGGLSGFGLMARDTQTALADEVAELERLGVSGADTAGSFQSLTKTFGFTTEASKGLVQQTEILAQELGISIGQAIGDLNKALPQLALLSGDQVTGAFKRLSEQAIETGLSIDQLTSIADHFMTFEAAGKAASSLNAVLGTQMFDTMSLLEAQLEGPQAFIDTFREQLQGSVGDFDSLNVYQKQAIANAAGLSVAEVKNLMNAEALTDEQKEQAKTREENLKATMDLAAELKALAAEMTVALMPIIDIAKGILSTIAGTLRFFREALSFIPKIGEGLGTIVGIIGITMVAAWIKSIAKATILNATTASQIPIWGRVTMAIRTATAAAANYARTVRLAGAPGGGGFVPMGGRGVPYRPGMVPTPTPGGVPGGVPGAGGMGKFMKGMGALGGAAGIYSVVADEGRGFSAGGMATGAMSGAMMGSMFGPGGALIGGLAGGLLSWFADGTDSTPAGPAIVGEEGPELIVPPPDSAVVNNSTMTEAVKQSAPGGASDQAVVAAINGLGTKMDALMQRLGAPGDFVLKVDRREFGRLTNEHFGAPGSSPVAGVK